MDWKWEYNNLMAHFAEIDSNNIVVRVLVVDNSLEHRGQDFLSNDLGLGGTWIQTSYNNNIRKNYAGIGYTYDATRDAFIPPKANCHPEETLDETTCRWVCTNEEHEVVADANI
jgi:hypothetical protein